MAATNNVLFISYDGMTDPLGQSQVIPYLAGLTRYGYEFTIISCDKQGNYNAHKKEVLDLIEKYPIKWRSIPYHKNPPVLSSVYDLYQIKKEIRKLQKKNHFDMVHTRPGLPTLAALWMKKKYGTRFLNDIRGFWADERVDGGMWNLKSPLYKRVYSFFKNHESESLEKADYNVCLTQAARKEILSWKKISNQPVKIEVIPCSADLELFNPDKIDDESKAEWARKLKIKSDDFVISYLGSIGGWYLAKEMMHFFKLLLEKIPNAKLLFISPHRHDQIKKAAISAGVPLENLIITKAKRNEVPMLLSFSSYSLFFIKPCYSKLSSSPTKHGEIMGMGIPVITNSGVGDVKEIVLKYNAGFIADNFSDDSFKRIIDEIESNPGFSKENIIAGAREIYSLQNAVQSYKKIYDLVVR